MCGWSVREVDETGATKRYGYEFESSSRSSEVYGDPEDVYWAGADAIDEVIEGRMRSLLPDLWILCGSRGDLCDRPCMVPKLMALVEKPDY
jgi:hypothetical protein